MSFSRSTMRYNNNNNTTTNTTAATAAAIIPPAHFYNLRLIILSANRKHAHLAALAKCKLTFTHWARMRAHKLGLTIDARKARDCPQRHVSVEPLPVLEGAGSPLGARVSVNVSGFEKKRKGGRGGLLLSGLEVAPQASVSCSLSVDAGRGAEVERASSYFPAAPLMRALELPDTSSSVDSGERSIWEDDMELEGYGSESSWTSEEDVGLTPEDKTEEPIMIRIKRKSAEPERKYDQVILKRSRYVQ